MQVTHQPEKNRFVLVDESGATIGELTYELENGTTLAALHTGVDPAYNGRGYAALLVDALAAYAAAQKFTIRPACSYVARAFTKSPDKYAAVIHQ